MDPSSRSLAGRAHPEVPFFPRVRTGPLAALRLAARGVSPPACRVSRWTQRGADGKLLLPPRRTGRAGAHATLRLRRPRGGGRRVAGRESRAADLEALGGPRFPAGSEPGRPGLGAAARPLPLQSGSGAREQGGGSSQGAPRRRRRAPAGGRVWVGAPGDAVPPSGFESGPCHLLAPGPRAVAVAIMAATMCRGPGRAT